MSEAEKQFHRIRRMFAVLDGELLIGPKDVEWSHREWFLRLGLDANTAIENAARGFVDDSGVYVYRGDDFHTSEQVEQQFLKFLPALVVQLGVPESASAFAGMSAAVIGSRWAPQKTLGQVATLLKPKG